MIKKTYESLPSRFYEKINPARFPRPELIIFNESLAEELSPELFKENLAHIFSGQELIEEGSYLAMAYAGHQFGHFVPQLGDGRAILLAEVQNQEGQIFDIQLKGAGQTPFSRQGDGRSSLGPVVREYLVSEAMHALGVPTTRALAAVATGELVPRQYEEEPGGVFTRVAASHLRIGTFEYFASRGDREAVEMLLNYAVKRHYPELLGAENLSLKFLEKVCERQRKTVVKWMGLGFIHGVMNTDNTSISGETIDYGPCAFMDTFKRDKVFSFIDRHGRYAYQNQGKILHWNLTRLAECLLVVGDQEKDLPIFQEVIEKSYEHFEAELFHELNEKIGFSSGDLLGQLFSLMEEEKFDFTLTFDYLTSYLLDKEFSSSIYESFKNSQRLSEWVKNWEKVIDKEKAIQVMPKKNPRLIPRNHWVQKAIESAFKGDYLLMKKLNTVWQNPYKAAAQDEEFLLPPRPEELVHTTFCGT